MLNLLKRRSLNDNIFDAVNYILLAFVLILVLIPLVHVVACSLSDQAMVMAGEIYLIPKKINFLSYKAILEYRDILIGFRNTVIYTVVGTMINVLMTVFGAYPLSRRDLAGRNIYTAIFAFTMFFSGGLIPTYLVVKQLNLLNKMWAVILPGAVSMYNMVIMRTFFQNSIPEDIYESAILDGASNLRVLWSIVLPLSKAIIAVITLFYVVGHWNSYFSALIYFTDRSKYTVQLFLRELLILNAMTETAVATMESSILSKVLMGEGIKYSSIIVVNLPVLLLYPLLQKYFVQGIMIGAIKG